MRDLKLDYSTPLHYNAARNKQLAVIDYAPGPRMPKILAVSRK